MTEVVPPSRVENPIAERFILFKLPTSEMRVVRLQIGIPLPIDNNPDSWSCQVALSGLYPAVSIVPGIDSLQCLSLSVSLLKKALDKLLQEGALLYWRDGSGPISLDELFS